MATPVGHTLSAYTILLAFQPSLASKVRSKWIGLATAFVFGNLADADFAVAYFVQNPVWRHHFFSHSIPFVILFALFCFLIFSFLRQRKPLQLALLLGAAYGTHVLLDFFTDDGSSPFGIPLLWPFTHHHFLASDPLFFATQRGSLEALISLHNLTAMAIECLLLAPVAWLVFRVRRAAAA